MSWWEEGARVDRLLAGWLAGRTADAIAAEIGTTRAAVLAKVDRLRKAGGADAPARRDREVSLARVSTPRPAAEDGRNRRLAALSTSSAHIGAGWGRRSGTSPVPIEPYVEVPEEPLDLSQAVTIEQLEHHHCRWPLGDPRREVRYCGIRKTQGLPYCERHARRAYQPPVVAEGGNTIAARPVNLAQGGRVDGRWRQGSQSKEPAAGEAPEREIETEVVDA